MLNADVMLTPALCFSSQMQTAPESDSSKQPSLRVVAQSGTSYDVH